MKPTFTKKPAYFAAPRRAAFYAARRQEGDSGTVF